MQQLRQIAEICLDAGDPEVIRGFCKLKDFLYQEQHDE